MRPFPNSVESWLQPRTLLRFDVHMLCYCPGLNNATSRSNTKARHLYGYALTHNLTSFRS